MAVNLSQVDPNARRLFAALQSQWGGDLPVISGVRTPEHNAQVGGAKRSRHLAEYGGDALDVDTSAMSEAERNRLIEMARGQGFGGVGVYDNSLHLDTGDRRAWGPSYKAGSIPEWAKGALEMRRPIQTTGLGAPGQRPKFDAMVAALMSGLPPGETGQPAAPVAGGNLYTGTAGGRPPSAASPPVTSARPGYSKSLTTAVLMGDAPQGEVAEPVSPVAGGNVRVSSTVAPQPQGAPGQSDVANMQRMAEAAGLRADSMRSTNITKGLAQLANQGVEAFGNIRAGKMEDRRQAAMVEALGGGGGREITPELIAQIMPLDPDYARELQGELFRQQAEARQAAERSEAKQGDRDFTLGRDEARRGFAAQQQRERIAAGVDIPNPVFTSGGNAGPAAAETTVPDDVDYTAALGAQGIIGLVANTVVDLFGGNLPAPEAERASQALTNLQVRTQGVLQNSIPGRPSNYLMQQFEKLTVTPGSLMQGPARARERLGQTRDLVQRAIEESQAVVNNPVGFQAKDIAKAQRSMIAYQSLLRDYETILQSFGGEEEVIDLRNETEDDGITIERVN